MTIQSIPEDVKTAVLNSVAEFNRRNFGNRDIAYVARFKGRHAYLDRTESGSPARICRLTFTGEPNRWQFAIFKYSTEQYSADEWFFPGDEEVDGTVEGAMRAGMKAYPP